MPGLMILLIVLSLIIINVSLITSEDDPDSDDSDKDDSESYEEIQEKSTYNETNDTDTAATDEDLMTAIKDVAYYLRSHKFNDFDRRFIFKEEDAVKNYFASFPSPPLKALHWEVQQNCESSFVTCVQYLQEKAVEVDLRRSDDTTTLIVEEGWIEPNNTKQITSTDSECQRLKKLDERETRPFLGPLERFQWRTSASYYMCWYTMKETPALILFGEPCDNFANCLDPKFKSSNKDPRADDRYPFNCAMYSFCPDPCCAKKYISSLDECRDIKTNPCLKEAPKNSQQCDFNRTLNQGFRSVVLNHWNVTCQCSEQGFEWSSRYGICIDVNECMMGLDSCNHSQEACFNLPGSYRCGCRWGYLYDTQLQKCERNQALILAETPNNTTDEEKPVSILQTIKKFLFLHKSAAKNSSSHQNL